MKFVVAFIVLIFNQISILKAQEIELNYNNTLLRNDEVVDFIKFKFLHYFYEHTNQTNCAFVDKFYQTSLAAQIKYLEYTDRKNFLQNFCQNNDDFCNTFEDYKIYKNEEKNIESKFLKQDDFIPELFSYLNPHFKLDMTFEDVAKYRSVPILNFGVEPNYFKDNPQAGADFEKEKCLETFELRIQLKNKEVITAKSMKIFFSISELIEANLNHQLDQKMETNRLHELREECEETKDHLKLISKEEFEATVRSCAFIMNTQRSEIIKNICLKDGLDLLCKAQKIVDLEPVFWSLEVSCLESSKIPFLCY